MDLEALNYIPVPVVILDRADDQHFVYEWMNKAAQIFSGFGIEQLRGRNPREVFPDRSGEQLARRQETAARSGRAMRYSYPMTLPRAKVWIETDLMPVRNEAGEVTRLIATMQDKTAERALRVESVQSEIQLQNFEADVETYISLAAHDLRSPMRKVQQIADLLREDFVDHGDGKLELIEMMETIGSKAHALINDVLAHAQATGSKTSIGTIELSQLAEDVFTVLDPLRKHSFSSDSQLIETDTIALQIALRNLTDNTIKHAGRDSISLHIGFDGEANGDLFFHVRDDGCGFSDPSIAFLESGDFTNGSGFGLLGIKRMIHARGGKIYAERPGDGAGALIRFSLPGSAASSGVTSAEERPILQTIDPYLAVAR